MSNTVLKNNFAARFPVSAANRRWPFLLNVFDATGAGCFKKMRICAARFNGCD